MNDVRFTDRYDALGIRPPRWAFCPGRCEATGIVPIKRGDDDERLDDLWLAAEWAEPAADGWHFLRCPDCNGDGRAHGAPQVAAQLVRGVWRWLHFVRNHVLRRPYGTRTINRAWHATAYEPDSGNELNPDPPHVAAAARRVYAERLDVPHPWMWNRRLALRVALRRTRR